MAHYVRHIVVPLERKIQVPSILDMLGHRLVWRYHHQTVMRNGKEWTIMGRTRSGLFLPDLNVHTRIQSVYEPQGVRIILVAETNLNLLSVAYLLPALLLVVANGLDYLDRNLDSLGMLINVLLGAWLCLGITHLNIARRKQFEQQLDWAVDSVRADYHLNGGDLATGFAGVEQGVCVEMKRPARLACVGAKQDRP